MLVTAKALSFNAVVLIEEILEIFLTYNYNQVGQFDYKHPLTLVCKLASIYRGQGETEKRGRTLQTGRWQV